MESRRARGNALAAELGKAVDGLGEQFGLGVRFLVPGLVVFGGAQAEGAAEIDHAGSGGEQAGGQLHGDFGRGGEKDDGESFGANGVGGAGNAGRGRRGAEVRVRAAFSR